MADLITVDDIEAALGRPPEDAEEEALWGFYISVVSDYINEYVSVSFSLQESVTERFKASWSGLVKLLGPVHQVVDVVNFRTENTCWYADWDGTDEIYGLQPEEVVDVTYTYGYVEVPSDIQNLAISALVRLIGGEETSIDLRSHQVGDVRDEYRDNSVSQLLGSYGETILAKYADETFSIDTGGSMRYPNYMSNQIPTPVVAVGDDPTLTDVDPDDLDTNTVTLITFAGTNWRPGVVLQQDGVTVPATFDLDALTGTAYVTASVAGTADLTILNLDETVSDAVEITFADPVFSLWDESPPEEAGTLNFVADSDFSEVATEILVGVAGTITGLKWYKPAGTALPGVLYLYDDAFSLITFETTFTGADEATEGWVEAELASPYSVSAGETVVASAQPNVREWFENTITRTNGDLSTVTGHKKFFGSFSPDTDCFFVDIMFQPD